ncbi:MAG: DNA-binding response regulator [Gemmatimonadetes bacterium]|nr:MAG: DNA-binding response regulator [Gemmatimonadota bacterium]
MKVLIVEDDPLVLDTVRQAMELDGHECLVATAGNQGVELLQREGADLVILDVNLPDSTGFDIAARMRAGGDQTPILMLTARSAEEDVIQGLDAGADAYVTKPFRMGELLARVRALHRRAGQPVAPVVRVGDLEIDRVERAVTRAGRPIRLTNLEFKLLDVLVRHVGEVVSRETLLEEVWGIDFDPGTGLVKVHISHLRRKLEQGGLPRIVATVQGEGYRLEPHEASTH